MHWTLQGRVYKSDSGEEVAIRDFPFVVAPGDTVTKYGEEKTVSNVVYLENGGVMIELISLSEEV
jgi:hypothetical protein